MPFCKSIKMHMISRMIQNNPHQLCPLLGFSPFVCVEFGIFTDPDQMSPVSFKEWEKLS